MKKYHLILFVLSAPIAFAGQHLDKALEAYKKGPSAAKQVISELNLELKENPESQQALLLLAITQRGMAKFDDSLAALDRLEKINNKNGILNPQLYMLRVENYFFKKDYKKTRELLTAYWGIFQTSEDLITKGKALSAEVEKALSNTKESHRDPKKESEHDGAKNPEKEKVAAATLAFLEKKGMDSTKYLILGIHLTKVSNLLLIRMNGKLSKGYHGDGAAIFDARAMS